MIERVAGMIDELVIERLIEAVILHIDAAAGDAARRGRRVEDGREIDPFGFFLSERLLWPMIDIATLFEHIDAADHLVEGAEAHLRHVAAHLFGDEEEEIDDVLGRAGELGAQGRVLRGDADGAGVEVALAHHDAAQGDQRRGGEAELFGAEQGGDGDVAAGLEFAIGLEADAAAQIVHDQDLLGFGQAEFPRDAGVLDGTERRSAGAAGIAGDEDGVGVRFGDAGGDGADADFGDQLDGDARLGIDVLQIVDELREIFDGVNIVVRRRRDEADAGDGVAHARDDVIDFVAGKLAAFAGLGALGHFDLQLVGIDQVIGGDAEAAGGDLLDGGAAAIIVARLVFPALAGVGFAADAVHGEREGFVRFLGDGAERHGAGGEALDDLFGGLDLFERDGLFGGLDFEQAAERAELAVARVDELRVFLERAEAFALDGVLQLGDGIGVVEVIFAVGAELVVAADGEFGDGFAYGSERVAMLLNGFFGEDIEIDAADAGDGAGEVTIDQFFIESDGFEDLGAAIALQRGDAHFGEGFQQAFVDGLAVVVDGGRSGAGCESPRRPEACATFDGFEGQVGVDGAGAIADQQREVHDFARLAGFDDDGALRARLFADQVVVDGSEGEQAGDGGVIRDRRRDRRGSAGCSRIGWRARRAAGAG